MSYRKPPILDKSNDLRGRQDAGVYTGVIEEKKGEKKELE